jgi:hypothetical protein
VKEFIGNVLDCVDVCLFCTVGIMSRSGYWGTGGIVTVFTQICIKESLVKNFLWMDVRVYISLKNGQTEKRTHLQVQFLA